MDRIEKHFGIVFPEKYKDWIKAGYIDCKGENYLWVNQADWIQPAEMITTEIFQHSDEKTWVLDGLIPFALNKDNDYWCWYRDMPTENGEYAILFCYHNGEQATVYAPCLAGWLYRIGLDYSTSIINEPEKISLVKESLLTWAEKLDEMKAADWADDLRKIAGREPFEYERGPRVIPVFGLITYDECHDKIEKEFGKEYLDKEVEWLFDEKLE